jgi:membrane protease YdiL (CAAX protease family)
MHSSNPVQMKSRSSVPPALGLLTYAVLLTGSYTIDKYLYLGSVGFSFFLQEGVLMFAMPVAIVLLAEIPVSRGLRLRKPDALLTLWLVFASVIFVIFYYYSVFLLSRYSRATYVMVESDAQWMRFALQKMPAALLLLSGLYVAFSEEIFFRGFLLGSLEGSVRLIPLCIAVGLLFSVVHLMLGKLVPVAVAGAWFTYVSYRAASVWIGVAAHFILNATGFGLLQIEPLLHYQTYWRIRRPDPVWMVIALPALIAIILITERIARKRAPFLKHPL